MSDKGGAHTTHVAAAGAGVEVLEELLHREVEKGVHLLSAVVEAAEGSLEALFLVISVVSLSRRRETVRLLFSDGCDTLTPPENHARQRKRNLGRRASREIDDGKAVIAPTSGRRGGSALTPLHAEVLLAKRTIASTEKSNEPRRRAMADEQPIGWPPDWR